MIRRITLLLIVLALSLSAPALADEGSGGIIEGRIVNGTAGGSSVAEQDIVLKTYLNDAEVGSTTTKTDDEGRFSFNGLSTEPDHGYQVVLTFQEAEYYGEWLVFDEGEIIKSIELTVYDSTTSDEAVKVATAHTVIYVEQGNLLVNEYFLFVNESDRTYIGSEDVSADGKRETLRFTLPKDANELQLSRGLMECCISGSEDGFSDTMPVLPGGREMAYSYKVDYNSGAYTHFRRINYPTASFDLFVQGEDIEVTTDQLLAREPLDFGGSRFNHFAGEDLVRGETLVIQLSGLPETSNQRPLTWVVLTLVVLVLGSSFIYLSRRRRLQPVSPRGSLEQRRQRLLVELAELDDDFEAGKLAEEVYRRLRTARKAQLVELIQRLKEESGNT